MPRKRAAHMIRMRINDLCVNTINPMQNLQARRILFSGPKPNTVLSTVDEAVNALEVLTLHEEQAHNGDPEFILRLERQSRILTLRRTVENGLR